LNTERRSVQIMLKDKSKTTTKPVCIIPARGGSRRIPRKNIRTFSGRPLIAWPIETALESKLFSRVVVSTDDKEIADIAIDCGAKVPFMRNDALGDDHTTTAQVMKDALRQIDPAKTACCLYPTAPLVTGADLAGAYAMLMQEKADAVISVTEYDFHPLRAFQAGKDGRLEFKYPQHALTRSQDLPELLHDAGAFYFFDTASFARQDRLVMDHTLGYQLPRMRALDIDTQEDLEFAELLHRHAGLKGNSAS